MGACCRGIGMDPPFLNFFQMSYNFLASPDSLDLKSWIPDFVDPLISALKALI